MSLSSLYLDAFYACAQTGQFTAAAERLHITQSALSQRIRKLEEELETTLFLRDRTGVRLTEQGEVLLRHCQTRTQLEDQLLGELTGESSSQVKGQLRIGGFSSAMRSVMLPAIAQLAVKYPNIKVRMISREIYELRSLLKSGEIDFMVLDESIEQEGVKSIYLGKEVNVLVEKTGYKGPEVYLDHDESDLTTMKYLKKKSTRSIHRHFLDDVYGLIDGVRLGMGRAVIPRHLIQGIRGLREVDNNRTLPVPFYLHFYEQPYYTNLHNVAVETIQDVSTEILD